MDSFILEAPNLTKLYLRSEDLLIAEVFRGVSKTNTLHLDYHDVTYLSGLSCYFDEL